MNARPAERFDLVGTIPGGTLAIEASAGTGKTFTLAALATRFIAELGIPAAEILIVTFTRAATNELRNRVRRQLVDAAASLRSDDPATDDGEDALLDHLRSGVPDECRRRLDRLDRAITEFDAATITTIHGFATQVLGTLGTDAGIDPDAALVEDARDRLDEVCADVLAAAAVGGHPAEELPNLKVLLEATAIRLRMPDLVLEPSSPERGADEKSVLLVELINRCVATIGERRRRSGTLSFDDVLLHLRTALARSASSAALTTLRNRFRVALIDEFQDTDPVQWAIFSTLFGEASPAGRMVLVGDPKQAIYAFRGANVHTFTEAVTPRRGLEKRSLAINWRSDGAMLTGLNVLFDGATFGDEQIGYSAVEPAPVNRTTRLVDDRGGEYPPISFRLALGPDIGRGERKPHELYIPEIERAVWGDLAERVVDILDHARLPGDTSEGVRVRPSDIAVLVRSAKEAVAVQRSLRQRDVPAVLARGASVLTSPAARQCRWLLEALLRPSDPHRARGFALSWFKGLRPDELVGLGDEGLGLIHDQLRAWGETLQTRGIVEWVRQVWSESGVVPRVLATADGDRAVTDLNHIAELFQAAAPHDHLSVVGLLAVLDSDPQGAAYADTDSGIAARRIESDRQAVQIMTVWVAKGLEFPIVCCPTMWHLRSGDTIYQDPASGRRTYDVANSAHWPDKRTAAERRRRAAQETLGEDLRLLYVGMTRAKHHTLVWWSRARGSGGTGLARVLFARTGGAIDPATYTRDKVPLPGDDSVLEALAPMLDRAGGTIAATVHGRRAASTRWEDPADGGPPPELSLARLTRVPDRSRHRWSFTAVTRRFDVDRSDVDRFDPYGPSLSDRGADDERGAGDPADDEPADRWLSVAGDPPGTAGGDGGALRTFLSPLVALPAGAEFGTLVHCVLERVDFTADDLDVQLATGIDERLGLRPLDITPTGDGDASPETGRRLLVAGLRAAIDTPLGPLFPHLQLRDLAARDRLNELSFELWLGEAGYPTTVRDIAQLVLEHLEPSDPLRAWAVELSKGAIAFDLAGHLTGSIDAVVRTGGAAPRFVVIDYKSNRLTPRGEAPRAGDYSRDALVTAMAEHHYPLQALIYSVALHRYLRWRLAGYDPARHLGGIAYLFLRGMSGADVEVRHGHPDGVFSWAVPPALVTELSDLLDGRRGGGMQR
ncbi:MAG: UvrD-helicase domain-containing protein [Acidimicrobiales bacterium]